MPPPPLSDAAVLELLRNSTDDKEKALGLEPDREDSPDQAASDEAWLAYYHQEWARVYRYGLAEDAIPKILKALEAPADPSTLLATVLTMEDLNRLWPSLSEMCKTDCLLYPLFTQPHEHRWWVLFPLALSAACLVLLPITGEIYWVLGGLFCGVLGFLLGFRGACTWRINPKLTFYGLAEFVQREAKLRVEDMNKAAKQFCQPKLPRREH